MRRKRKRYTAQVLRAKLFDRWLAELNDTAISATEKRPRRAS